MFSIQYHCSEMDEISSFSSSSLSLNDSYYPLTMEEMSDPYSMMDWTLSQPDNTQMYWPIEKPAYDRVHPRFNSANARLLSDHCSLLSPTQPILEPDLFSISNETPFQFDIVLDAPTAVIKKHDDEQVTYLNRGQLYLVEFKSNSFYPGTLSSTISLSFHEPSHRAIADNYWKYWIAQQDSPHQVRAMYLDMEQSTGIYNIRMTAFDRVTFDWHGRFGANIYLQFNCLSTDFSKIKGVKGIPMRMVVETTQQVMTIPHDITPYKGTFHTLSEGLYQYKETCYCKIKLFRDKGAERKNKDDRKQKDKQLDKVMISTHGHPEQHPLWPILNQKHEYKSRLTQIPQSPDIIPQDFNDILPKPLLTFYAWTLDFSSTPQEVQLETLTTQDLKQKLATLLHVPVTRIADILWRHKKTTQDVLVLVEDTFISEHIADGEMMTVNWEIKNNGLLRVILEF